MATDPDPFTRFRSWVAEHRTPGLCLGDAQNEHFLVKTSALRKYWTLPAVEEILGYGSNSSTALRAFSNKDIINNYPKLFSTCVYISSADSPSPLWLFAALASRYDEDPRLPLESLPTWLQPTTTHGPPDVFLDHHYMFFPVSLGPRPPKSIPPRAVVLLSEPCDLRKGRRNPTAVIRCVVDPENGLSKDVRHVVLKKFHAPHGRLSPAFMNERNLYTRLQDHFANHWRSESFFPAYYGWLQQGKTAVLLLEYADKGSLSDLFALNHQPNTKEELVALWRGMLNVIRGLAVFHDIGRRHAAKGQQERFTVVHQDLKPSNILVWYDAKTKAHIFKICDFGLSSVNAYDPAHPEIAPLDSGSTKMYSPPELCRSDSSLTGTSLPTSLKADVWSLGCLLLEFTFWTVCGSGLSGLEEFRHERERVMSKDKQLCSRGYDTAFFDSNLDPSSAITSMINMIKERRRVWDTFSAEIAELFLKELLCKNPALRLSAEQASGRVEKVLDEFEKGGPVPHSEHARGLAPRASHNSVASASSASSASSTSAPSSLTEQDTDSHTPVPQGQPHCWSGPPHNSVQSLSSRSEAHSASFSTPERPRRPERGLSVRIPSSDGQVQGRNTPTQAHTNVPDQPHTNTPIQAHISTQTHARNRSSLDGQVLSSPPRAHASDSFVLSPQQIARTGGQATNITPHHADTYDSPGHAAFEFDASNSNAFLEDYTLNSRKAGTGATEECVRRYAASPDQEQQSRATPSHDAERAPYEPQRPPLRSTHRSSMPNINTQEVLWWRKEKKANSKTPGLPGISGVKEILKSRDQLFLLDDSFGMAKHWSEVQDCIQALGYIAKEIDPDKVDLRVTSNTSNPFLAKSSTAMVEWVKSRKPVNRNRICVMASALRTVTDSIISDVSSRNASGLSGFLSRGNNPAGISIYILTDGIWDSQLRPHQRTNDFSDCCGVDAVICEFVGRLISNIGKPKYASIQFVRFGDVAGTDNPAALARLNYLDNELKTHIPGCYDIVDTKHHTSSVWSILIGSVLEAEDNYVGEVGRVGWRTAGGASAGGDVGAVGLVA